MSVRTAGAMKSMAPCSRCRACSCHDWLVKLPSNTCWAFLCHTPLLCSTGLRVLTQQQRIIQAHMKTHSANTLTSPLQGTHSLLLANRTQPQRSCLARELRADAGWRADSRTAAHAQRLQQDRSASASAAHARRGMQAAVRERCAMLGTVRGTCAAMWPCSTRGGAPSRSAPAACHSRRLESRLPHRSMKRNSSPAMRCTPCSKHVISTHSVTAIRELGAAHSLHHCPGLKASACCRQRDSLITRHSLGDVACAALGRCRQEDGF
jgi:hypothetical protein